MRDIEIPLPARVNSADVEHVINDALAAHNLRLTLRGTLKKFPGCIHWHAKDGDQSGTLEITFWPQQHRAWFTIQSGRAAPWIDAKIQELAKVIEEQLR